MYLLKYLLFPSSEQSNLGLSFKHFMYSLYILMGFIDIFTQMYHVLWPYASPYSIFPFPRMSSLPFPRFTSIFMLYMLLFSYLQNRGSTSGNTDLSHLSQWSPVASIFLKITYSHSSFWMNTTWICIGPHF